MIVPIYHDVRKTPRYMEYLKMRGLAQSAQNCLAKWIGIDNRLAYSLGDHAVLAQEADRLLNVIPPEELAEITRGQEYHHEIVTSGDVDSCPYRQQYAYGCAYCVYRWECRRTA